MEGLLRELVSNVLSRLPVKDLMRCKCVCKFWFDLITHPQFIENYYVFYNTREVQQQEHLLLIRTLDDFETLRKTEISIVSWNPNEPRGLVSSQVLSHPQGFWEEIMGPCNGVYFLKGYPNIIMNPSLNQYIALPVTNFNVPLKFVFFRQYPSFGFDPKTNDFKVVMLAGVWLDCNVMVEWTVGVYSLNSNSWKILEDNPIPFPFEIADTSRVFTYVNNCCHWWGYVYKSPKDESDGVEEDIVLSFDMVSELFRMIKVPKITHYSSSGLTTVSHKNLIPFSESATIGVLDYYRVDQGTEELFCFDVWMMKDYWDEGSWIKRYSVGPMPVISRYLHESNQSLWYTREKLLLYGLYYGSDQSLWNAGKRLVVYGLDSEEPTRDLLDCENYEEIGVVRYMESIVSLQMGMGF